jgi:murein L,D-transpeptidase YafK
LREPSRHRAAPASLAEGHHDAPRQKGHGRASADLYSHLQEESELEVWKQRDDGRYYHFKTYPVCNWSGDLGPKVKQGDRQAPEGFYTVTREQMNPDSKFHLAMNLGYPNSYDRAHRRTGEFLMIHGKCKSAGCYAMTDALIEEIYAMARETFVGGHDSFQVHAFPFRMSDENMVRYARHEAYPFWKIMKEGYDYFEISRQLPTVAVCNRRYGERGNAGRRSDAARSEGACPAFLKPKPDPFKPRPGEQIAEQRIVVPGRRCVAWPASKTARSVLGSCRPARSARGRPPSMSLAPGQ